MSDQAPSGPTTRVRPALLGTLKEGQAVIPGIRVEEIELYDLDSFRPTNLTQALQTARTLTQLR